MRLNPVPIFIRGYLAKGNVAYKTTLPQIFSVESIRKFVAEVMLYMTYYFIYLQACWNIYQYVAEYI